MDLGGDHIVPRHCSINFCRYSVICNLSVENALHPPAIKGMRRTPFRHLELLKLGCGIGG